jgi:hypothetical protein
MTHDELMYKVDDLDCAGMVDDIAVKALRAVVELHKPDSNGDCCNVCLSWPIDHEDYPCLTIQAIEKELA